MAALPRPRLDAGRRAGGRRELVVVARVRSWDLACDLPWDLFGGVPARNCARFVLAFWPEDVRVAMVRERKALNVEILGGAPPP
ncbi:hypothetical protein GCM10027569_63730 [Flindersiella endophytica]